MREQECGNLSFVELSNIVLCDFCGLFCRMAPRVEKLDPVKDQHKSEQKVDKSSKKAKSESASLSRCMLHGLKLNQSAA